jgi:hypothetical protein
MRRWPLEEEADAVVAFIDDDDNIYGDPLGCPSHVCPGFKAVAWRITTRAVQEQAEAEARWVLHVVGRLLRR